MRTASIVVSVLLIWGTVTPGQVSKEPVIHFPPLPPSIPQLVASVELVVFGQMVTGTPPRVESIELDGLTREFVRRYQQVEVLDFLKGRLPPDAPPRVSVRQVGGVAQVDGRTVSNQIIQRILQPGDKTILFLNRVPNDPAVFYIAHGPDGVLVLDKDKTVELPPRMQGLIELHGRKRVPIDEILGLLRGAGG